MMKLQDVILKAMAKKLTWMAAAEIAGMSVRNMQRKRQAYIEHGYDGLFDQRRGRRSIHRVAMETAERVLALYQEKYSDFNVQHFHEKLRDVEGIRLSYSWVRQALQGAGLVSTKTAQCEARADTRKPADARFQRNGDLSGQTQKAGGPGRLTKPHRITPFGSLTPVRQVDSSLS
jgi:transposase